MIVRAPALGLRAQVEDLRLAVFGFEKQDRVVGYGLLAGVFITIIGVRFLVWPQSAAATFGLALDNQSFALHSIIGLRDVWLGVLVLVAALGRAFSPLSHWFLVGALVCFGDAAIVSAYAGPWQAIVFHVLSGVFCGGVGLAARGLARDA